MTSRVHVLMLVPSFRRGGAEVQLATLAARLAGPGLRVTLMSFETGDGIDQLVAGTEVEIRRESRKRRRDKSLAKRLAQFIDREGVQVVHATLQIAAYYAIWARRLSAAKPPVLVAVHTTLQRDRYSEILERLVFQRVYRQADQLLFVCKAQAEHWCARYRRLEALSTVIYNGIDTDYFSREHVEHATLELRKSLGIPQQCPVVTCVAAFRPEKGQPLLVRALRRLESDAVLLLIGDGELRTGVEALVDSLGLKSRVVFVGEVDDVRPYIAISDCTVLASSAETFSMAMLESMALAVPMVAPALGGLGEAIEHGVSGWLYRSGDVQALTDTLASALADPARTRSAGAAAARVVRERFAVDLMVERTRELLLRHAGEGS